MKIVVDINDEMKRQNSSNPELTSMFLCLEHEGHYYPSEDWIDNPAIVLGWWLFSITDIINGGEGQGFNFMEGPYSISSNLRGNHLILTSEDNIILWNVELYGFARELLKAMNQVSKFFYEMGITDVSEGFNREMDILRKLLQKNRELNKK